MSLPRYPEYKDSGVTWLGPVPKHWEIHRLKKALTITKEVVGTRSRDYTLLSLTLQGVIPRDLDNPQGKFPAEFDTYQAVRPRDLIFCLFDVEETPRAVGISRDYGMVTGAYTVARVAEGFHPEYLHYYYLSRDQYKALKMYYTGLRNVIRKETFYSIPCPLPPLEEQIAISAFLDRETAKIDALVAEQEKLIALLKEKRQAVISHAVTKGLDPTVPMKDSGIPWLGEVPAHWKVRALKSIVSTPITDGPHETPVFLDEGVPFVSAEAVSSGSINFDKIRGFISAEDHARYSLKYRPQRGDIYMVKSGATTGVAAIVETDQEFNIWSPLAVIRCSVVAAPHFVLNYLRSRNFQEAVTLNWSFGTQQNIGMGVIENLAAVLPPLLEQISIAAFLDRETASLDALTSEAEKAIDLLKERRSALISAAVTGKIDVRGVVAEQEAA